MIRGRWIKKYPGKKKLRGLRAKLSTAQSKGIVGNPMEGYHGGKGPKINLQFLAQGVWHC